MKSTIKKINISAVIPMRNSETTILHALESLISQKNEFLKEIIVVDNASTDESVSLVRNFAKKSIIPINTIVRRESKTIAASFNLGVQKSKYPYILLMHSDSALPTKEELRRLVRPIIEDISTIGTYSTILHPESLWEKYNFWMKALFARNVGKLGPGLKGKFDCIQKKAFESIKGFDEKNFGGNLGGGEDADFHIRLAKKGKVVLSKAKVIHLHYLGEKYSLMDWLKSRRYLSRTYGRLIRIQGNAMSKNIFIFLIKPILAILPFIPGFTILGIILLMFYSVVITKKMFITPSTLSNRNIIILPFINIFLLYYETFWMLEAFLTASKRGKV